MSISLPDLPFARDALAPHMSAETLDYHHGKHHKAYVDKTNSLIEGTALANRPLETIIAQAYRDKDQALFNQAAQVFNHGFFWQCLTPRAEAPPATLKAALEQTFGDIAAFRESFTKAATGEFGSGWAWLVSDDGVLKVLSTDDADTPLIRGQTPLLTLDVWEHAYYLDHRNDRGAYIDSFFDHLINWSFVAQNLDAVSGAEQQTRHA